MATAYLVHLPDCATEFDLPAHFRDIRAQWRGEPIGPGRSDEREARHWRLHGNDDEFQFNMYQAPPGFWMEAGTSPIMPASPSGSGALFRSIVRSKCGVLKQISGY